ncbi:MAG: phosphatase PAP2-related protein [Limisphaerales bacterium]
MHWWPQDWLLCALVIGFFSQAPATFFQDIQGVYAVVNDFFFSGHAAFTMLGAIEVARLAPGWLGLLVASIAILEAVTVVILRAHYTMDIIAALFAAWVAADLAGRLCVGL